MKNILILILVGISNIIFAQNTIKLSGKIVDENLNCLFGVIITNLNSGEQVLSDKNGRFEIKVTNNDSLEFRTVGLTTEKIKIKKSTNTVNLILISKKVNCLGALWTEKQYRKANREIEKQLRKLYKIAKKQDIWNKNCC